MTLLPPPRIALAAIFRNEHPYVLEWIAHHRALGVERFYIADNISDDGTSELLQALHDLGVIRRIAFASTPGQAPQLPAYAELLGTHARDEDWIAVIDADEFTVPTGGARSLAEVLAPLAAQEDIGAVVLNWAIHGSAWLRNHSAGLVCERFTRRAHQEFGANHHYKTVLRRAAFAAVHSNPHHFVLQPGWRCVHTDGSEVTPHARHGLGLSERVVWQGLRLNHYIVKSREEFETRKARNGSAATVGRVKGTAYFEAHDRNDTGDRLPPWLLQATRLGMAALVRALADAGHAVPEPNTEAPTYAAPFHGVQGHIDRIEWRDGRLCLRGWAMHESGAAADRLHVQVGAHRWEIAAIDRCPRPDLKQHFPMAAEHCGFQLNLSDCNFPDRASWVQIQGAMAGQAPGGVFAVPDQALVRPDATAPCTIAAQEETQ
ncbi:glycosyltransferase family 2 protein [Sphaerotilus sp.]|jgi:Glycosyl transferase family 2|uniref:glycosyltransferase family 2 protein n=1 Tax=Sphaerotilus sp. TaxID=2093942 RepID=UPI0025F9DAB1|nr:glycosyltransferase family 2 protein [Sphaerotilus sp.]